MKTKTSKTYTIKKGTRLLKIGGGPKFFQEDTPATIKLSARYGTVYVTKDGQFIQI